MLRINQIGTARRGSTVAAMRRAEGGVHGGRVAREATAPKFPRLLDDLGRLIENRLGNRQPERLGGL